MLKILFHFYNLLLIILYIYPGSILGFLVYKDLSRQPQITSDFFSISSKLLTKFSDFDFSKIYLFPSE